MPGLQYELKHIVYQTTFVTKLWRKYELFLDGLDNKKSLCYDTHVSVKGNRGACVSQEMQAVRKVRAP